jgi:hypothetical protein
MRCDINVRDGLIFLIIIGAAIVCGAVFAFLATTIGV